MMPGSKGQKVIQPSNLTTNVVIQLPVVRNHRICCDIQRQWKCMPVQPDGAPARLLCSNDIIFPGVPHIATRLGRSPCDLLRLPKDPCIRLRSFAILRDENVCLRNPSCELHRPHLIHLMIMCAIRNHPKVDPRLQAAIQQPLRRFRYMNLPLIFLIPALKLQTGRIISMKPKLLQRLLNAVNEHPLGTDLPLQQQLIRNVTVFAAFAKQIGNIQSDLFSKYSFKSPLIWFQLIV